jgi:hypothetical protein
MESFPIILSAMSFPTSQDYSLDSKTSTTLSMASTPTLSSFERENLPYLLVNLSAIFVQKSPLLQRDKYQVRSLYTLQRKTIGPRTTPSPLGFQCRARQKSDLTVTLISHRTILFALVLKGSLIDCGSPPHEADVTTSNPSSHSFVWTCKKK